MLSVLFPMYYVLFMPGTRFCPLWLYPKCFWRSTGHAEHDLLFTDCCCGFIWRPAAKRPTKALPWDGIKVHTQALSLPLLEDSCRRFNPSTHGSFWKLVSSLLNGWQSSRYLERNRRNENLLKTAMNCWKTWILLVRSCCLGAFSLQSNAVLVMVLEREQSCREDYGRTGDTYCLFHGCCISRTCCGSNLAFVHVFETLHSVIGLCFLALAKEEPELRHWMPVLSLLLSLHGHNPFQDSSWDMGLGRNYARLQEHSWLSAQPRSVCPEEHHPTSLLVKLLEILHH